MLFLAVYDMTRYGVQTFGRNNLGEMRLDFRARLGLGFGYIGWFVAYNMMENF